MKSANKSIALEYSPEGKGNTLGTAFQQNTLTKVFDKDSLYFTAITSLANRAFYNIALTYVRLPFALTLATNTSAGNNSVFYTSQNLIAVRLDSVTTIRVYNYDCNKFKYTVITTPNVPTLGVSDSRFYRGATYVIDSLVDSYKAATNWSSKTIRPISQLPTDYPNCPWLDDLREKGLIG